MGALAAIAAFFTGAAHVAPTSVPIDSTSTIEVTQNYNNEINNWRYYYDKIFRYTPIRFI